MRDPAWLDDDDDLNSDPTPRHVRPLLVVLAALPWLLVVALFVVPGPAAIDAVAAGERPTTAPADLADAVTDGGTSADREPITAAADAGTHDDDPRDPGTPRPPSDAGDPRSRVDAPVPNDVGAAADADLAAVALLAARRWLSGADRHDDDPTLPTRDDTHYAEHLHLEGMDGDEHLLVARIVALLLNIDRANAPRLQRIAVPLATTPDGPRLLGEPWELPTPTFGVQALRTEPLTDPVLLEAAEQALEEAGFAAPRVRGLARTAGWPMVVSFTTGQRSTEQQVWLRAGPADELTVAGQAPAPDPVDRRPGGATDPTEDFGDRR